MANYKVSDVAAMAGVSVRTLHHYHEIGLLRPAAVGENGYRYYGREELLRLQQILIHREFGIPLAEIGAILDAPGFDRLTALRSQRRRIAEEAARSAEMLRTIDRTIAELKGDRAMKDAELYSGIVDPKKQAEYKAWTEETCGPEIKDHIETSRKRMERLTSRAPSPRRALDPLIERHSAWVKSSWGQDAPVSSYAGLADTYLAHPDFVARYERIEPGFAGFLATAMRSWAARQ